jgi:hypothetical protein
LFAGFCELVQNSDFFAICGRGISRISAHHPGLLVEHGLVEHFIQSVDPSNQILTEDCLFALESVASEIGNFEALVPKFWEILGMGESRATLMCLRLMGLLLGAAEFVDLVERNHFEMPENGSILGICGAFLSEGAAEFRVAALEVIVGMCEKSNGIRLALYDREFVRMLGTLVDSIDRRLAARLIVSVCATLPMMSVSDMEECSAELRSVAEIVETDVGEFLESELQKAVPSRDW